MKVDLARELAVSRYSRVKAAAGCGKTHLIAKAVSQSVGRQLILTHTHAGVHSLRIKMTECGVHHSQAVIRTIASWCLRYARSYPHLSGWNYEEPKTPEQWHELSPCTSRLLKHRHIRKIIEESYAGVYVDEYQDCNPGQHEIISQLSILIPCRVLGDPLQAIYAKLPGGTVDWTSDVISVFNNEIGPLETPYRWKNTNPELGKWLKGVRENLESTTRIDLESAHNQRYLNWITCAGTDDEAIWKHCNRALNKSGSIVILRQGKGPCSTLSKKLKGRCSFMETVECEELFELAEQFRFQTASAVGKYFLNIAKLCITSVGELASIVKDQQQGRRRKWHAAWKFALFDSLQNTSTCAIKDRCRYFDNAMAIVEKEFGLRKYHRYELWTDFRHGLRLCGSETSLSLSNAIARMRERRRHYGLRSGQRIVARPILVKGLEFDHVLVLDAERFDPIEIYVALTRGAKSLTVISKSSELRPVVRNVRRKKTADQSSLFDSLPGEE